MFHSIIYRTVPTPPYIDEVKIPEGPCDILNCFYFWLGAVIVCKLATEDVMVNKSVAFKNNFILIVLLTWR